MYFHFRNELLWWTVHLKKDEIAKLSYSIKYALQYKWGFVAIIKLT